MADDQPPGVVGEPVGGRARLPQLGDARIRVAGDRSQEADAGQRAGNVRLRAGLPGGGQRLLVDLRRSLLLPGRDLQRPAVGPQHLGPLGRRRLGRHQADRLPMFGQHHVHVGRPGVVPAAHPVQQAGADRVGGRVHLVQRLVDVRQGPGFVAGVLPGPGRPHVQPRPVRAGPVRSEASGTCAHSRSARSQARAASACAYTRSAASTARWVHSNASTGRPARYQCSASSPGDCGTVGSRPAGTALSARAQASCSP
ncbi:MAG TPA: hypothetical protein VKP11_12470, partial [Frankiaceae bacterium]|nr:hypothetical protein [Frankiaceae bacterium]